MSDDGRRLSAGVDTSAGLATAVVRALDAAGVLVDNIEVRQPSLDDVFFSLTGEHVDEGDACRARMATAVGAAAARRRRWSGCWRWRWRRPAAATELEGANV